MVTEVPDQPNPKAVAMARWVLFGLGVVFFAAATIVFTSSGAASPSWAFVGLCTVGAVLLLSSAFGRPGWLITLVLLIVEP